MKGASPTELRTQIDLLLFQAFPPHPHTKLSLPAVQKLSLNPILFTQVPALDTVSAKLVTFIDGATWPSDATQNALQVKQVLATLVLPYLKGKFPANGQTGTQAKANPTMLSAWSAATSTLINALPLESVFPLVDMWRLAFLDADVGAWCSATGANPINVFLAKATSGSPPRNFTLTLLRMLCNTIASPVLARQMVSNIGLTAFLVPTLLHDDAAVRTAAASLAFNLSSVVQKSRVDKVRGSGGDGIAENEDWQVEMTSAVIEAIDREKANEDVGGLWRYLVV
jgi:desumoylating isopeptidase 1